jgi:signal transduction histidine kinase
MFTGILHDLSQRRRLEREVLEAAAAEQRRIGQDLHDGLGQLLTGTAFAVEVLGRKLSARAAPETASIRKLAKLIDQAIGQARQLARGLHPVSLEQGGLAPALEALAAEVENPLSHPLPLRLRYTPVPGG